MSSGHYRQAGNDLLRVVTLDRAFLPAYKSLGYIQLTLGKEDAAVKTLQKAIAIDPGYVDAYCVLSDAFMDLGRNDEALEMINKALELDPEGEEPHCKMAMYCLARGDFKRLRAEQEILQRLNPDLAGQIGSLFFEQ